MHTTTRSWSIAWTMGIAALIAAACTSDRIVYRSTQFPTPPAAAGDFLGYSDTAQAQTVCGNCHVDRQTQWSGTAHAKAWATLQGSGGAKGYCEVCHTVNNLGNQVTDTAVGYRSTHSSRYHDVQCESCHGPGLTHVTSPSISNRPLAQLAVGKTLTSGCGECHNGTHHPFVEEWSLSAHATMPQWSGHAKPQTRAECQGCHTGQGALKAWGVTTAYKEAGFAGGDTLPIACGVCHDPHENKNPKQLRFPIDVADVQQNLCMKCHQKGSGLDPSTSAHGPHSPEGPLLLGTAGWWPPGMTVPGGLDTIVGTHGTGANPGLCATCHVSRFAVNDTAGNIVFQVTGHQFRAIPCLDSRGIPTADTSCTLSQRTFQACSASGCHGSPSAAQSAYTVVQQRIASLDTALLAQIHTVVTATPAETSSTNTTWTTAQGALFNSRLAERKGSFVHNPFLIEALLTASIRQMTATYSVPSPRQLSLENVLLGHAGSVTPLPSTSRR